MNKSQSIMLDLLRFLASILVFIHHSEQVLKASFLSPFASFGHDAVIFFFILSGFVIGYVSSEKERSISEFIIARFVRIYSVAFPALVLSFIVWLVGTYYYSDVFTKDYSNANWISIFSGSLIFLNQTSLANISVPVNGAYWSISYEVWYYILFGTFFYMAGLWRLILLSIFAIVAGIKILILFPIWILGYMYFVFHSKIKINYFFCFLNLCVALLIYGEIRILNLDDSIFQFTSSYLFGNEELANKNIGYSKRFASDYVIAVLFVIILSALLRISNLFDSWLKKCEVCIRFLASYTFALYLFHSPLLWFFSLTMDNVLFIIGLTMISVVFIGYFTEKKKAFYKAQIEQLFRVS